MGLSVWQILIVVALVILLFGRGKISDLMGDVAQGIKSFRKGLAEDETTAKNSGKTIEGETIQADAAKDAEDAARRETMKN
ncbi:twin-arginine translocase TatA/TatE family subunit [Pyruvatibacter sp.]|uniref:twin-arginine translocase TatA/TatE family subunit n=1 Tax=Pyruvatibacter sp. TaxID=1981328 RepID=UPI0032EDE263